jgi:hypothetical protein
MSLIAQEGLPYNLKSIIVSIKISTQHAWRLNKLKRIVFLVVVLGYAILLFAAWDLRANVTTETLPTSTPVVWSPEIRCEDCHKKEVESLTDTAMLAYTHAAAGKSCLDCHDAKDLQVSHKDSEKVIVGDLIWKYSPDLCFKCHDGYAAIIELTKGMRLNPHDAPHDSSKRCFICHPVHIVNSTESYCINCHKEAGGISENFEGPS